VAARPVGRVSEQPHGVAGDAGTNVRSLFGFRCREANLADAPAGC
jgi:hypothetical protein